MSQESDTWARPQRNRGVTSASTRRNRGATREGRAGYMPRGARETPGRRQSGAAYFCYGAGDGARTRDIQLGRLALCQLSYPRQVDGLSVPTYRDSNRSARGAGGVRMHAHPRVFLSAARTRSPKILLGARVAAGWHEGRPCAQKPRCRVSRRARARAGGPPDRRPLTMIGPTCRANPKPARRSRSIRGP